MYIESLHKKPLIFGSGVSAYKDLDGTLKVCRAAMENGIFCFDTAPSYRTEEVISNAVRQCAKELCIDREGYTIQTKIDPIQMYNGDIESYFKNKLKLMRLDYIDTLFIHWPVFNYLTATWESMLRLKDSGLAKKLGICNLRLEHIEELSLKGIHPEVLQNERHPLNVFPEEVNYCLANKIELQDYSPLCKMHPRLKENESLQKLAKRYDCDLGQLILRWHIDTGATPIFTSTKPERVKLYARINGMCISDEDIAFISSLNCNHKLYLESLVCPGF